MRQSEGPGLVEQLRQTAKDGIDYFASVLSLAQMKFTIHLFTFLGYLMLTAVALLLTLAAFVFLNIALGLALTHLTGSPLTSILILGCGYALLATVCGLMIYRWIKRVSS